MAAPARNVSWVVAFPADAVSQDISAHPDRFHDFRLVEVQGTIRLFEREGTKR